MLKKLIELSKDTAVYGVSTIIGRFLAFLLFPIYTNVFNPSEFGIYTLVYAYLAFLNVVYIYGMDAAFMKYTSLAEGEGKKNTFSTPFLFVSSTSILLSLLFYFLLDPVSTAMNIPSDFSYLLIYVIFILFFDTLSLIPFNSLRLERKTVKFATIKIINIAINLGLNLVLILVYDYGIEAIFISNLVSSVFSFIALLPEIIKRLNLKIDPVVLKKMLKFGLPYLPAAFASIIVQIIDVPIVERLTDTATLGLYRANYKLGIFMMLFVQMFAFAWQPFFLENAKTVNAKEIFAKVFTIFLVVVSSIWIILSLFIEDIVTIKIMGRTILGAEYLSGLSIVPIILLGYLFNGLYMNFIAGIYIEEKTKYFPLITGLGAAVNVIVNISLIPSMGIMGAALATLASYVVMAVSLFIVAQKFYKIDYEYIKILKVFALMLVNGVIYYYLSSEALLNLGVKLLIALGFISSIFILKVVEKEEFTKIIALFRGKLGRL